MLPLEFLVLPNTRGRVGKNRLPEYGSSVIFGLGLFSTDSEQDSVPPLTTHVTDCKIETEREKVWGEGGRRKEGEGR